MSSLFRSWRSKQRLTHARKRAVQWKRESLDCLKRLRKDLKSIKVAREQFEKQAALAQKKFNDQVEEARRMFDEKTSKMENNLTRAQELIDEHIHIEEMQSNELEVYRDVAIPQLVLNCELLRQQKEADIALECSKQAMLRTSEAVKE